MPLTQINSFTKLRTALPLSQIDSDHKDFKNMIVKLLNELSFSKKGDTYHLGHITISCSFDKRAGYNTLLLNNTKDEISYYCVVYLAVNKQVALVPKTTTFSINNVYLDDFLNKVLNDIRELWKNDN